MTESELNQYLKIFVGVFRLNVSIVATVNAL